MKTREEARKNKLHTQMLIRRAEEAYMMRKKYLEEKAKIESTPEFQETRKKRVEVQNKDAITQQEYIKIHEEKQQLLDQLTKSIVSDYASLEVKDVESIKTMLAKYSTEIRDLYDYSKTAVEKRVLRYNKKYPRHLIATLFLNLVDIDAKFLLFSPEYVLNLLELPVNELSDEERLILQERLIKFNIITDNTDKKFVRYNGRYFPALFKQMKYPNNNELDFFYALARNPEAFDKLADNEKNALTSEKIIGRLFAYVPQLFTRFTTEQKRIVKNLKPTVFFRYLMEHPEYLDDPSIFPDDLITVADVRSINYNYTKSELYEKLRGHLSRFPKIERYLHRPGKTRNDDLEDTDNL